MRSRRRVKIFISYTRADQTLLSDLIGWLQGNSWDPVFDDREIVAGDHLDMKLKSMIDQSDGFLAVGTSNYMYSDWCRREVEYAHHVKKEYLPALFERIARKDIAEWFTRVDLPEGEVVYAECYDKNFESLRPFLRRLGERIPIKLQSAVLLVLFFLIIVPTLVSWTIRQRVGQADREVHELQSWIEKLNRDIEERQKDKVRVRSFLDSSNPANVVYRDVETQEMVARDVCLGGQLNERLFFRNHQEVGNDRFFVVQAPNGSPSFSKRRQIYPQGKGGLVVEEMFDSIGNLISKRVKSSQDEKWRQYGDIGRSIYPPVLFCPYR